MGAKLGAPLPSFLQWMEADALNGRAAQVLLVIAFVVFKVYRAYQSIVALERVPKGDPAADAPAGDIGATFIHPVDLNEEEKQCALPRRRCREIQVNELGVVGCQSSSSSAGAASDGTVMFQGAASYSEVRLEFLECASTLDADVGNGFGEHVFANNLGPDKVCIGDIWRVKGDWTGIELCVSCPAKPGPALDEHHKSRLRGRGGIRDYCLRMGTTGWHCIAVKPGKLRTGDVLICTRRPHPKWTVREVAKTIYGTADEAGNPTVTPVKESSNGGQEDARIAKLQELKELAALPWKDWREVAQRLVLESGSSGVAATESAPEGKKRS